VDLAMSWVTRSVCRIRKDVKREIRCVRAIHCCGWGTSLTRKHFCSSPTRRRLHRVRFSLPFTYDAHYPSARVGSRDLAPAPTAEGVRRRGNGEMVKGAEACSSSSPGK
jgi:hypothetical protein